MTQPLLSQEQIAENTEWAGGVRSRMTVIENTREALKGKALRLASLKARKRKETKQNKTTDDLGGLIKLAETEVAPAAERFNGQIELRDFDVIVINSSGGKDSQTLLDVMFWRALRAGVVDRLIVVHADLGRMEWKGTRELAERQAQSYGLPFIDTKNGNGMTLLEYIERPRFDKATGEQKQSMWPDNKNRYCTSDYKRGPVTKVITQLVDQTVAKSEKLDRPVRVLNCMGLRAQESTARAKKLPADFDTSKSNGKRDIFTWLPILDWKESEVWENIHETGVEYHYAYDLGMPRLSCVFCVFAPLSALVIAGRHNAELLDDYIAAEDRMGHTFRHNFSLREVKSAIERGDKIDKVESWNM